MRVKKILFIISLCSFIACKKDDDDFFVNEDPASFTEIGTLDIGDVGAAEISAYDPATQRLFVVNNGTTNKIDVIDFKNPSAPVVIKSIPVTIYGGFVNSLDVSNGKLAAAIESANKQDAGKVVVFKTDDYSEVKIVNVGSLPDMVTYSPDGKYILTANEGEPSADYLNDPLGTVSVISVNDNYAVTNIDFSSFAGSQSTLAAAGLRVFGPGASFAKDMEPEYVAVSSDSKTAYVTLQENNAIAKINIASKTVSAIYPLGFKDYNLSENKIDPSDKDAGPVLGNWKVQGMYQPDAISFIMVGGQPYLFTANEGDVREYSAFTENKRVKDVKLDGTAFPNGSDLKKDEQLGRLNITTTMGDSDNDGDFDVLYSFGSRSFSVWNGNNGALVYDSKNELEVKSIAANVYDDTRSDDKGVEPEGLTTGIVGSYQLAFIGMERVDAVAVYDIANPSNPVFLQLLKCGDAPEGVLFISAKDSPTKKSLLVVSSENDGVIKVYTPKTF